MSQYGDAQLRLLGDKQLFEYISSFQRQVQLGNKYTLNALGEALKGVYGFNEVKIWHYCNALNSLMSNRRSKMSRLRKRIEAWLGEGQVSFLTITFSDDTFKDYDFQGREDLVKNGLDQFAVDYVANIDFGEKNLREHYHAVCLDLKQKEWKSFQKSFGFVKVEKVNKSSKRLCEYLDKLTNHALKDTSAFGFKMIYCRKRRKRFVDPTKDKSGDVPIWLFDDELS